MYCLGCLDPSIAIACCHDMAGTVKLKSSISFCSSGFVGWICLSIFARTFVIPSVGGVISVWSRRNSYTFCMNSVISVFASDESKIESMMLTVESVLYVLSVLRGTLCSIEEKYTTPVRT